MSNNRPKIAIVNVFFPPQAIGGATRVVADQVQLLTERYSENFDLVVFTSDAHNHKPYMLRPYVHNGVRVYSTSILWRVNMDWHETDPKIGEIFDKFLEFEKPDLIHFHCIQRLGGGIVEAARSRGIPYYVTAHDAWWISDYQFLTDTKGNVYSDGHPDPFSKYQLPEGITWEESLQRRNYLKALLADAEEVLCVSETYTKLYQGNGISNCLTNRNGISDFVNWKAKDTAYSKRVVCGHIGGMATHKGFFLFRDAVMRSRSNNIEALVVDHSQPENFFEKTLWGDVPVTVIGRVAQQRIIDVYGRIDVLFAPSLWPESFGLVTREAVACGCWVVASNVGAIGEEITEENGFVVDPTADAISSTLDIIDQNPGKYKQRSTSGNIRYSSQQINQLAELFNHKLTKQK
ncbi:glycosyltransferase family 4 protein [Burkholderia sp. NRF60-BP8]|uniref:glycosyltransferase family 4 protein n=1 Tax=Burkholderia sp. NRF60-BP8 TaxID=1637853 RepID=UPI0009EA8260|nr:glycosyltransferase family 4 protein [Burkholderia sp. NRF60-BP8]